MGNSYFQFKQFRINQDRSAMKVATDSCLLGAWFAGRIGENARVLDVGAGTGLLMLMLAQKNKLQVDGIELDPGSFEQLEENLLASPWAGSFRVFFGDARTFPFPAKYDFIISNPPFFRDDLRSPVVIRNQVRHGDTLNFEELIETIDRWLEPDGRFGLLIPWHRTEELKKICREKGFQPVEELHIRQSPTHSFFRTILEFLRESSAEPLIQTLSMVDESGSYTPEFSGLLRDYYLNL